MGWSTHDLPSFEETRTGIWERCVSVWTPVTKNENDDGHPEKLFFMSTTTKSPDKNCCGVKY
jgi:hypothetical protein